MIDSYKDLILWQKTMDLALEVDKLTKLFPIEELHGLSNQFRKVVVSFPSNIAAGKGRHSKAEYLHYLIIANVSLAEVYTQLRLAIMIGYVNETQAVVAIGLRDEISRMLSSLRTKLGTA